MSHFHSRTRNQYVVLPPAGLAVPRSFRRVVFDNQRHSALLAGMQRLRGKIYLDDGAIRPIDLTPDGRHQPPSDARAWHVLSLDEGGRVVACIRYLDERDTSGFRELWVSHASLAHCPRQGWKLRGAVASTLQYAREAQLGFGSVGGWATAPEERRTAAPVAILLATYGLLELLGGCLGVATATFRHRSASILRKIGLTPLSWSGSELPPYFDPQYGCEMEVLGFDSGYPNPRYRDAVDEFTALISLAPVICREVVSARESMPAAVFAPGMAAVA